MTARSWFHEQFLARAIAAAVWTLIIQVPIIIFIKMLCNGYEGFWDEVSVVHVGSWASIVLVPLSICGLTFSHLKYYLVEPIVYRTRFAIIKHITGPSFLLLLATYSLIGGTLIGSYLNMVSPILGSIIVKCQDGPSCLNELNIFGVLFGFWIGLCEGYEYFFSDRRIIQPPHVQQPVSAAVRAKISCLCTNSLFTSAKRYACYLVIYFVIGGILRHYFFTITHLAVSSPLGSVFSLFNPSLAARVVLIGGASILTMRLSNLLFNLYQLKPISFPIERYGDDITPLLQDAIASETELMKLWASLDWRILAEQSMERRAIIFVVSQPGSHPHNWNRVISSVLSQCLEFIAKLKGEEKVSKPDLAEASVVHSSEPTELFSVTPTPTKIRSLAMQSPSKSPSIPAEKPEPGLQDRVYSKCSEMWESFKKKPIISFIWGEFPDVKRRQTFAKAEAITLLVEGLSHFVASSISEDQYGVVQKDLPEILSMFLELQQAVLQRGSSTGLLAKDFEASKNSPLDVQAKHKLKWAVKSSIYRMVVRFKHHILNVQLPPTQKQMLEQYLEFRVG